MNSELRIAKNELRSGAERGLNSFFAVRYSQFSPRHRRAAAGGVGFLAALLLVACAGCSSGGSRLALDSFKDPYFPERYSVSFSECAYRIDPSGDHHILARTVSPIAPGQGPIEQWLHIHVFWKPRPGKTPDNPTSTDAVIRYVISTPDGLASYRGTGYVYPQRDRWTGDLVALLESGRLRLDLQRGDAPDLLGEARLTGRLRARNDGHAAVDLVRRMDVLLGTAVHAAYAAPGGRP